MQEHSLRRLRWLFLVAAYVTLLVGGWLLGGQLMGIAAIELRPSNEPMVHMLVMTAAATFILASALPFVPGAEIGLALLVLFGAEIALLVYCCMVVALLLAYLVGRMVPQAAISAAFAWLGLNRAHQLVSQLAPLGPTDRLALLARRAPSRVVPFLLRHRHLALIAVLNMPGNSVVGGGGGIALCAGLSGLFPIGGYLLAILLAVAPVPLFFSLGRLGW